MPKCLAVKVEKKSCCHGVEAVRGSRGFTPARCHYWKCRACAKMATDKRTCLGALFSKHWAPLTLIGPSWATFAAKLPSNFAVGHLHCRNASSKNHLASFAEPSAYTIICMVLARCAAFHLRNMLLSTQPYKALETSPELPSNTP